MIKTRDSRIKKKVFQKKIKRYFQEIDMRGSLRQYGTKTRSLQLVWPRSVRRRGKNMFFLMVFNVITRNVSQISWWLKLFSGLNLSPQIKEKIKMKQRFFSLFISYKPLFFCQQALFFEKSHSFWHEKLRLLCKKECLFSSKRPYKSFNNTNFLRQKDFFFIKEQWFGADFTSNTFRG